MTSKRVTLFSLLVMNRMVASTSSTTTAECPTLDEASTSTFMQQQTQDDQPVEQTRKNIQVLKGLPESQLFPLMNFAATSLGVKCDY